MLSEKDLAYKRACDLAQAVELAARNTAELASHAQPRESNVYLVSTATKKEFKKPTMNTGEQCYRCGGKHDAQKCWHKKSKCHRCTKVRHLKHICKSKTQLETMLVDCNEREEDQDTAEDTDEFGMYYIQKAQDIGEIHTINWSTPKYMVKVVVGKDPIQMELDIGAVVSVASEQLYNCYLRRYSLEKTNLKLRDYHGRPLELKGVARFPVQYERQKRNLPLVIVAGNRPALLGRIWLEMIRINWSKVCNVDIKGGARTKDRGGEDHRATPGRVQRWIQRHQGFKGNNTLEAGSQASISEKQSSTLCYEGSYCHRIRPPGEEQDRQ